MTRWVASLVAIGFGAICLAQVQPGFWAQEYVPGEVLIKFRPGVTAFQMDRLAKRMGGTLVPSIDGHGIMKLRGSARWNVPYVASGLRTDPAVEIAEPNGIVHACYPNDPYFGQQTWLPQINWPAAMALYRGSPNIILAVIDSGAQLDHPDLAAKIVAGWDFVNNDGVPNDDYDHGTHVAGIAAAVTDNATGIAGTCPLCALMPVKVLNAAGSGSWENTAAGIDYATNHGAHVINMSLGAFETSDIAHAAIQRAAAAGVVIVCAAGNGNSSSLFYPAAYTECIAVGSVNGNDSKSAFSDFNSGQSQWVDVAAPGESIMSTWPGSTYNYDTGTSMATPFVSGEAALLYGEQTDPIAPAPRSVDLATRVRALIENSVKPLGDWVLKGRINIGAAVAAGQTNVTATGVVQLATFMQPTTVPVTIQVMQQGTSTVAESQTVSLDANGNYSAQFASVGVFDLRFSTTSHFLARRLAAVALSRATPVTVSTVRLPNGDVNLDGAVNLLDLSALLAKFNTGPGPADLNGDGAVNLPDLSTLLASFGLTSDQ